jgi:hypothetical protein
VLRVTAAIYTLLHLSKTVALSPHCYNQPSLKWRTSFLKVTVPFPGQNWNLRAAASLLGCWTSNIGSRSPLVQIWICLPFPLILSSLFVALIRVYFQFLCGIFLDGITVLSLDKVLLPDFCMGFSWWHISPLFSLLEI